MNAWVMSIALMGLIGAVAVLGISQESEDTINACICGEPGCGPCTKDISYPACVCGEPGCGPCTKDLCICGEPGCAPC